MSYDSPALDTTKLLDALKWRYAVKKFDPAKKIDDAIWAALEESLVLTPSSYGLQPWKFLVIRDPELRAKLKSHSWDQTQVVDASHYIVFAMLKNMDEAHIEKSLRHAAAVRKTPFEALKPFQNIIVGNMVHGERSVTINTWASNQVFIALGQFMLACATLKIDACPMEGFDRWKYDEILGLGPRGYASVVCAAAGYRAADDKYAQMLKVRFDAKDIIEHL